MKRNTLANVSPAINWLPRLLSGVLLAAMLTVMPAAYAETETATSVTSEQLAQQQPDVNINAAGEAELAEALEGVGPAKAKAIVAWRQQHGPFKSLEDLGQVKGIGPATLQANKAHILFK